MKLEGSLDAFSLPDIFQLLSFTKKSGGLHLRRAAVNGSVYFRDGAITGATSDDGRQALARRLVGGAAVGDDELAAAVDRAANGGIGVGRALLEAGAVDAEFLRGLVAEQAVDAVFDFLRWSDGDFSFTVDEPGPDDVGVALGVESIVDEARGRLESWEHACRVIPSPDTVLALPIAVREDPQLSRGEWSLLALVDGRRTVADLVSLAGRGDFAVVSQLATLVERGLLALRSADADEGAPAQTRRLALLSRLESNQPPAPASAPAPRRPDAGTRQGGFAPLPASEIRRGDTPPRGDSADESIFTGATLGDVTSTSTVASVLAAANNDASPFARAQPHPPQAQPNRSSEGRSSADDGRGARLVADSRTPVTPARPEPFMPRRRPEYPEDSPRAAMGAGGGAMSSAAVATASDSDKSHIERDPSVNKSLLLRLIAGVRGL